MLVRCSSNSSRLGRAMAGASLSPPLSLTYPDLFTGMAYDMRTRLSRGTRTRIIRSDGYDHVEGRFHVELLMQDGILLHLVFWKGPMMML
jgi:hypothetical protein